MCLHYLRSGDPHAFHDASAVSFTSQFKLTFPLAQERILLQGKDGAVPIACDLHRLLSFQARRQHRSRLICRCRRGWLQYLMRGALEMFFGRAGNKSTALPDCLFGMSESGA